MQPGIIGDALVNRGVAIWLDAKRTGNSEYGMYRRFLQASSDLPCNPPPWGMLSAVDLNEGKIKWQVPLGSMQNFGGAHKDVPRDRSASAVPS
jgi:glucose dehydrogenase